MIVFYSDRSALSGKHTIPAHTTNFDRDSDISDILISLQEVDMFEDVRYFDISHDFTSMKEYADQAHQILKDSPHHIWWYSSKKPSIQIPFTWFEPVKQVQKYNIFDAVDLLVAKNKKDLWLYYQTYLKNEEIQEIIPSFLWGIKSMLSVMMNATDGMSPFVINKMKKNTSLWTKESLLETQFKLIEIYEGEIMGNNAHRLLEVLILSL